jgi:hypothetical protein
MRVTADRAAKAPIRIEYARLVDAGLPLTGLLAVPNSG